MPGILAFVRLTGWAERGWVLPDLPEDLPHCLRGATGLPLRGDLGGLHEAHCTGFPVE